MLIDDQKQALVRALVGGVLGMAAFLLLSWLTRRPRHSSSVRTVSGLPR